MVVAVAVALVLRGVVAMQTRMGIQRFWKMKFLREDIFENINFLKEQKIGLDVI